MIFIVYPFKVPKLLPQSIVILDKTDYSLLLRLIAASFSVGWRFSWNSLLETEGKNGIVPDLEILVDSTLGKVQKTIFLSTHVQINNLFYFLMSEIWAQQMFIEMANIGDLSLDTKGGENVRKIIKERDVQLNYFAEQIDAALQAIEKFSLIYPEKGDLDNEFLVSENDCFLF